MTRPGRNYSLWGLALALCLGSALPAGAATLTAGMVEADAGQSGVSLAVSLQADSDEHVSAAQFDLVFESNTLTVQEVTTGAAAAAAGKTASSYVVDANTRRVIIIGMNQSVMASGEVATVTLDVSEQAHNGIHKLSLKNAVLSDPVGVAVPVDVVDGSVTVSGGEEGETTAPGCFNSAGISGWRNGIGGLAAVVFLLGAIWLLRWRPGHHARPRRR